MFCTCIYMYTNTCICVHICIYTLGLYVEDSAYVEDNSYDGRSVCVCLGVGV